MGALEEGHFEAEMQAIAFGSEGGAIEDAVRVLLNGLGEDPDREELRKTPARVAKAFRDGTRGYKQKVEDIVKDALFPEAGLDNGIGQAGGAGGLVVVRDIHLFSYCESCLLPFSIQCHVGYVPSGKRVLGLSKLSRVADVYAKRLQEPNRLAHEICSALQNSITPAGVSVALQCCHIQSPHDLKLNPKPIHPSRSSMQGWVRTSVSSCSGVFKDENTSLLDEFHSLLKFMGVTMGSSVHPWCPSTSLVPSLQDESISRSDSVAAVASILRLLHEDPSRKELVGTPYRYVNWLMNFRKSQLCTNTNGATDPRDKINGFIYGKHEIHSELNLPFCAQCEHHLLPFYGVVHIGFFHESKRKPMVRPWLQALVSSYGCQLQVQERLTRQIAEAVHYVFGRGVMVVAEASHICMISRGIEQVGSSTATMAVMGQFTTDAAAKALFLGAISKSTATGG